MSVPTWNLIDFGFANDDADSYRAFVRVTQGPLEIRRTEFGTPGVNGVYSHNLGTAGQQIQWSVDVHFVDESAMSSWESALDTEVASGTAAQMEALGTTYDNVILEKVEPSGQLYTVHNGGSHTIGRSYVLTFRSLG